MDKRYHSKSRRGIKLRRDVYHGRVGVCFFFYSSLLDCIRLPLWNRTIGTCVTVDSPSHAKSVHAYTGRVESSGNEMLPRNHLALFAILCSVDKLSKEQYACHWMAKIGLMGEVECS